MRTTARSSRASRPIPTSPWPSPAARPWKSSTLSSRVGSNDPGDRPEGGLVKRRLPPLLSSLVVFAMATGLLAQAYGPAPQSQVIPASACHGRSTSDAITSNGAVLTPTSGATLVVPIDLPNGAVLEGAVIFITNEDPFNFVSASLKTYGFGTSTATTCGPDTVWTGSL